MRSAHERPPCRRAGDIDRDEDVAEVIRKCGYRPVELTRLERGLRLACVRVGDQVELFGQRVGTQPAALGTLLVQKVLRSARRR